MILHTGNVKPSETSLFWSPAMSARFWPVAIMFYLVTLAAGLTYVINDECGYALIPGRADLFVGLILFLIGFEIWVYRRFGATMTRRVGIGLLIARMVLFEATMRVDCSGFTAFLYLLIPFLAYFFLNRWASLALAGLYFGWFSLNFTLFRCSGCDFDEYVTQILVFGLAILWVVVMAGLIRAAEASRVRAQLLLAELEQSRQQLKAYAAQAWELATAEERNRLARDIHDSIGHYLAGVNIQLEKALTFHRRDPAASEQAMHDAKRAAREALQDVRQSVRALRHSSEIFSLSTALMDLAARWRNGRLEISLNIEGDEAGYSKPALMALYRAAQEGMTNVVKHAQASQVQIWLKLGSETAHLRLCDNGKGFDQEKGVQDLANPGHHYGLQGIRERLAFLGGQLVIESSPGAGTVLAVTIPKTQLAGQPAAEGLV